MLILHIHVHVPPRTYYTLGDMCTSKHPCTKFVVVNETILNFSCKHAQFPSWVCGRMSNKIKQSWALMCEIMEYAGLYRSVRQE